MRQHPLLPLLPVLLAGCGFFAAEPGAPDTVHNAPAKLPVQQRPAAEPDAEGFVPLGPGDFVKFSPPVKDKRLDIGIEPGLIRLRGDARGYLHTVGSYRDFTLRFEYDWPDSHEYPHGEFQKLNTGVLVFITGPHKVWPRCLEVQGRWDEMGHIKSNAKDVTVTVRDDPTAREAARNRDGEWNAVEIVARGGSLTSYLNGIKIAESDPTELRDGPIGFQAEGYDVDFRNVRIKAE